MKQFGLREYQVALEALATLMAGCFLMIPAWVGTFSSGAPSFRSPKPSLVIVPAMLFSGNLGHLYQLVIILPAVLFFLWNPQLFRRRQEIPLRSSVLLGLFSALTACYFVLSWNDGIRFEGLRYTRAICIMNLFWLILLWLQLINGLKKPSFIATLCFHWMLFAWLGWYAFPYLGELP